MGVFFFTIVIYPLTQIIELAFTFSNKLLKNTGFSLVGVSLAVSLLTLPLYAVAEHWQEIERNIQAKMKPQVDRIKKAILNLDTFPQSHQERNEGRYAGKGYRQLLIDNYIAIFRIDEADKKVYVITIQYQGRNF